MHPQMQPSRHPLRAGIAAGITLVLAAVLWLLFAPQSLGGDFAYALVRGSSMSPALANNDLVLIRSAADYDVGDAVAYRDPQLGTVLHRIVDDDGERFTLQGDNRDAADPYRPTSDEIVGRTWAVIPGAGRLIREIQRPRNAALLVVAAVALIGASAAATRRRGRASPGKPPEELGITCTRVPRLRSMLARAHCTQGWSGGVRLAAMRTPAFSMATLCSPCASRWRRKAGSNCAVSASTV